MCSTSMQDMQTVDVVQTQQPAIELANELALCIKIAENIDNSKSLKISRKLIHLIRT